MKVKCKKCKYEWESIFYGLNSKKKPKSCPRCKRYDWDLDQKINRKKNKK